MSSVGLPTDLFTLYPRDERSWRLFHYNKQCLQTHFMVSVRHVHAYRNIEARMSVRPGH
jgi:hypothetical protein